MKGRPYTAADEYAARLATQQLNADLCSSSFRIYSLTYFLVILQPSRSVQNAYRDYREIRVQVKISIPNLIWEFD